MNNTSKVTGAIEAIQEPTKTDYMPRVKLAILIVVGIIILAFISRQCRASSTSKKIDTKHQAEVLEKLEKDCASLVKNATNESLDKVVKLRYIERSIGSLSMLQKVYNANILTTTQKQKDDMKKMISRCMVARRQYDKTKQVKKSNA